MRFLGSNFTQNALAAGALPRAPLGELHRSPRPLADFEGLLRGREKGKEGKEGGGKGVLGRETGREGKGRGEGGKGEGGGKGREGEFASLALGGIDAPADGGCG